MKSSVGAKCYGNPAFVFNKTNEVLVNPKS